jgi:hypothetical protein
MKAKAIRGLTSILLLTFMVAGAYSQEAGPAGITFAGGPGDSMETAVIIKGAHNSRGGVEAEYYYLEKQFGRQNVDWKLDRQRLMGKEGKKFDLLMIILKDGAKKNVYFDITEFFGKL